MTSRMRSSSTQTVRMTWTLPWTSSNAAVHPCPGWSALISFERSAWRNVARSRPVTSRTPQSPRSASAARRGVALADRGDWGVLDVTGRDRATFLHALLSNEIKALQPGQGCTAALLDVHGKVQVILTVWVLEDRIRLVMPRGLTAKISQALDHYLFSEKASFTDASDETALLMLLGPEAPATIERLTGVRPPAPAWSNLTATLGETTVRLVTGGGRRA